MSERETQTEVISFLKGKGYIVVDFTGGRGIIQCNLKKIIKMLESKIQKKIIKLLEERGYMVANLIKTNLNGIPDLLVITGQGEHFWVEVKQETGKLSKLQEYRIGELEAMGDTVIVPYGYDDFIIKFNKK